MIGNATLNYVLITPCKNEQQNLPNLIKSISEQTIKPIVWAIVDDGSTDGSVFIIQKAIEKYPWIKHIRLESDKRDVGLHLSQIMKLGFENVTSYCNANNLPFHFVGNIDADITVDPFFFEHLLKKFTSDSKLGVASGGVVLTINGKKKYIKGLPENEPSGGDMLIRKECFYQCGGMPISYAWDSVIKAKARLNGWSTKRFEDVIATEIRDVGNAEGYWKGYLKSGKSAHYLNYNPLHVMLKSLIIISKRPHFHGFAYLLGYFSSMLKKEDQIEDPLLKAYFWSKSSSSFLNRLKG